MNLITIHPLMLLDGALPHRSPAMVLRDDYMLPRGWLADELAQRSGIPAWHLRRILQGAPIFAHEARQLAAALYTSALYWLVLQARHDLARAEQEAMANRLSMH